MSVKKESNGKRSVQVEIEVPGTPEEVWQAIATGPGISSWFMPTEFDERDGSPVAMKIHFGPGIEIQSEVTTWDPPKMFRTEAGIPGSPPIANEWSVEARGGGVCVLRIVQSLFASTDDWDDQLGSAKSGLASFLRILQIYLTNFRGQRSTMMKWMVPVEGSEAEAWEKLTSTLGLQDAIVGKRYTSPEGVPELVGVVEYVSREPYDLLVRTERPAPAVVAFGSVNFGGPVMIGMNVYLYGDQTAECVVRETPLWEAWFQKHFPMPAETNIS